MARQESPLKLAERDVTRQVRDFLAYRQWRPVRMQRTVIPGAFQTGEDGMADYLFIHYLKGAALKSVGISVTLWVEFKAPGARDTCTCSPTRKRCRYCSQTMWRAAETARGATVIKCSSFEAFEEWYQKRFGWIQNVSGQADLFAEAAAK